MKRKIYKLLSCTKQSFFAFALTVFSGTVFSQATYTFNYTGNTQTISLPAGYYRIECWGADGGTNPSNSGTFPGKGGYSKGDINLSTAAVYSVYVGGKGNAGAQPLGGFNSGNGTTKTNSATATGGGGASDVRVLVDDYFHRIIVAGGGGGQGTTTGTGGNGGGLIGQNGQGSSTNMGVGGTQTAPGVYPGGGDAKPAAFGEGSDGPAGTTGGQGGGGWYGGSFGTRTNGGGAGGSGYVLTSSSFIPSGYFSAHAGYYFSNPITLRADESGFVANPDVTGNGMVIIRELCSISLSVTGLNANGAMCPGQTVTITTNAISNFSWTTGSSAAFLVVSPTTNSVYGLTAMSPSNCTSSSQVTINVSAAPSLNVINNNPVVCLGGEAVISVTGADTYSWSTNATVPNLTVVPTQKTTYTITGTNTLSNCGTTQTVSVDVFTPTVAIGGVNTICKGETTTLTASAAGAISYSWSTGLPIKSILVSPSNHAIYVAIAYVSSLNITCAAINSIQVTVNPIPNIVVVTNRSSMCVDESVDISAGGGTSYAWSWGTQTSNAPTIAITSSVISNIILNVSGTDANGCSNTATAAIIVNLCTGIDEASLSDNVLVYPNPSQGEINVTLNPIATGSAAELLVFNETGQLVRKISLNDENEYKANITDLSNGIYFITAQNGTQRINKKVIVNR